MENQGTKPNTDEGKEFRIAQARAGKHIETYIHDEDPDVRKALSDWAGKCLENYDVMDDILDTQVSAPSDIIRTHIKQYNQLVKGLSEAWETTYLHQKLAAGEYQPQLLEVTMSQAQLYIAGNPIWCRELTFIQTYAAINHIGELKELNLNNVNRVIEMVKAEF